MAIARDTAELFRPADSDTTTAAVLPLRPTIHISDDDGWHGERVRERADRLLQRLEAAQLKGRTRRATRLVSAFLRQVHLDRLAYAREVAHERGLRFDPIGRGPVVDGPVVHYRDRLPWYLTPVDRFGDRRLIERAKQVLDAWNGSARVFDAIYIAREPVGSNELPVHSLVGAISRDGRTADWFVLDRWAS